MQVTDNLSDPSSKVPIIFSEESYHSGRHSHCSCQDSRVGFGHRSSTKNDSSKSKFVDKVDITHNFQNIQTCSNSKMSHKQERIQIFEQNAGSKVSSDDYISSKKVKRSSIQGFNKHEDQILQTSVEKKGILRKIRQNSNSLEVQLPQQQNQQNQQDSFQEQNFQSTQKTIVISTSQNKKQFHTSPSKIIVDSIETIKNLNIFTAKEDLQIEKEHEKYKYDFCGYLEKSSCSSEHQNKAEQIWNQEQYELQDVLTLNEKNASNSEEQQEVHYFQNYISLKKQYDYICKKYEQLMQSNQNLHAKVTDLQFEQSKFQQQKDQKQMLIQEFNERWAQLSEENQELNSLILDYKKTEYHNDLALKDCKQKILHLEHELKQCQVVLQKKDDYIQALMNALQQKVQDNQDALFINKELEDLLEIKKIEYQNKSSSLHQQINDLRETVDFYQVRLEQEGFNFNFDQIKKIKELFESQVDHEKTIINNLSKEYSMSLANLQNENKLYASQIKVLKDKTNEAFSEHYEKHFSILTSQTQSIINNYDAELEIRDEQILQLKQRLHEVEQTFNEININHCKSYSKQVQQLTKILMNQKIQSNSHPELVIQFVYVVDKLCRIFQLAEKKINWLDQEKRKIMTLMNTKEKLFVQEVNEMKFRASEFQYEKKKIKDQNDKLLLRISQLQKTKKQIIQNIVQNSHHEQQKKIDGKKVLVQDCNKGQPVPEVNYLTLEQLLKANNLTSKQKIKLSLQLIKFAKELLKESKKPKSIKPNIIKVKYQKDIFKLEYINSSIDKNKESEKGLIYSAPEVLLGFSESQNSYVWTLGLIFDFLFHGSFFYKKINEVTSRAENYYCRDQNLAIRKGLELMLKKKQKERWTLDEVKICLEFLQ